MQKHVSYRDQLIYARHFRKKWDKPDLTHHYLMKITSTMRGIVSKKAQRPEDALIVFDPKERQHQLERARKAKLRRSRLDRKGIELETGKPLTNGLGQPFVRTKEVNAAIQRSRMGMMLCKDGKVRHKDEVYGKPNKRRNRRRRK